MEGIFPFLIAIYGVSVPCFLVWQLHTVFQNEKEMGALSMTHRGVIVLVAMLIAVFWPVVMIIGGVLKLLGYLGSLIFKE